MAEKTIFEQLDVQYEERDGIFYPLLSTERSENVDVGKYGHLWMNYIKEEFPVRYNSLLRFGNLEERAAEYPVEEVAGICGVDADLIRAATRAYATSEVSSIQWGLAVDTATYGVPACHAIAALSRGTQ